MTYQESINAAANLHELRDTLNAIESELAAIREESMSGSPRLDERVDITSLPTYGGPEPTNTAEVYSWDDAAALRVEQGLWYVEPR